MSIFRRNKQREQNPTFSTLTGFILYSVDDGNYIPELCLKDINLFKSNILIPNIGETFIDKTSNTEYEVKDIVRTFDGKEYGVQVHLKHREKNKYKMN